MPDRRTIFMLRPRSTIAYGQDFLDAQLDEQSGFTPLYKEDGAYPIHLIKDAQVVVGQNPDDEEESRTLSHLSKTEKTAVFVHCQWEYFDDRQQGNVVRALEGATIGMTPAAFLTEKMRARFPGVRWKTVDGCVDTRKFYPSTRLERRPFRSRLGLAEGDKVVLFAGRLEPAKGTQILKDLCANAHREFAILVQYPAWQEIREKKKLFQIYENICDELSILTNVRCIPDNNPRLDDRPVRFADAFVSPSLSEVQPLVLLEALASGVPFVGTNATPDYADLQRRFSDSETLSSAIETIGLPDDLRQGAIPRWREVDFDSQAIANDLVEAINQKAVPDDASRAATSADFLARGFTVPDRILKFRQALEDPSLDDASLEDARLEDALL